MNKICVYTCITGNYDNLKEVTKENGIDYYCFTNNKNIKSESWRIVYIEDSKLSNVKLARKIKILGHPKIKDYEIKLWMDAAVSFKRRIKEFINYYLKDDDNFVAFKHGCRNNIKDEAFECVKLAKEKKENVIKLLEFYEKEKYPDNNGLIESTVFIKKDNELVKKTMKMWFNMILKYSHRDQLSFNYCIYKTKLKVKWIEEKVFDNEWFDWKTHNKNRIIANYRLYFGNDEKFKIENDVQGKYKIDGKSYIIEEKIVDNVKSILIAPCHIKGIILKNIKVNNKKITEYQTRNTYKYNDYVLFYDENPFIIIEGNYYKEKIIKIELEMEIMNEEKLADCLDNIVRDNILKEDYYQKTIIEKDKENENITQKLNLIYSGRFWKIKEKLIRKKNVQGCCMENKFKALEKQIFLNKYIYSIFLGKKKMIMKYYKQMTGQTYDIDNPKLFTEKINTRKLDKNPLFSLCANKIKVRDYVRKKIGEKYLIPCYFTSKKMTEKLYDKMPKSCVLKTAGGSGTIKVIYDKEKENKKEIVKLMNDYLNVDFAYIWGEMFYKKIPKGIICEKLLLDKDGKVPRDYKIHCFNKNGKFKCILQIEFDRFGNHSRNIYDENFNLLDVTTGLENNKEEIEKPETFDEMIRISKKLSEDFDYVRVDLYSLEDKVYFGELTFTHNAGFTKFNPEKYNEIWGNYWE